MTDEIKALSAKLAQCKDEAEALVLARQLRTLLHAHIEELRRAVVSGLGKRTIDDMAAD